MSFYFGACNSYKIMHRVCQSFRKYFALKKTIETSMQQNCICHAAANQNLPRRRRRRYEVGAEL